MHPSLNRGFADSGSRDAALVARAARHVAVRVAALCAAMVVIAVASFYLYLGWRAIHPHEPERGGFRVSVSLDLLDLAMVSFIGLVVAVIFAAFASSSFSRSAVQPLVESLEREREFVANASHELKTPIAVVDARAQQLEAMAGADSALRPVLRALRDDTAELAGIVDDMLALARDDVELGTSDAAAEACSVAGEFGDSVVVKGAASAPVAVPARMVRRVITALVANALDYSPEGHPVVVTVEAGARDVVLRVVDTGAGIQGVDPQRVFDRFARGAAPHRRPDRPSHGIGLALVAQVSRRYGGSARVERTGPTGTTMRVSLPGAGA